MNAEILERLEAHRMHCTAAEYHAHEALSCSQFLSAGLYTETEEFWTPDAFARRPKLKSKALDIGTLLHAAYYEPETFRELYAFRPLTEKGDLVRCDSRQFAEWSAAHAGKVQISPKEFPAVTKMADAIFAAEESGCLQEYVQATELVSTEQCYLVQCPRTGLWLRIKPDRLRIRRRDGALINEDTKSSREISPTRFHYHCRDLGYYRRGAFYDYALELITGVRSIYRMIAVESDDPYRVALYEPSERKMQEAREQNDASLDALTRCIGLGDFRPAWLKGAYEL